MYLFFLWEKTLLEETSTSTGLSLVFFLFKFFFSWSNLSFQGWAHFPLFFKVSEQVLVNICSWSLLDSKHDKRYCSGAGSSPVLVTLSLFSSTSFFGFGDRKQEWITWPVPRSVLLETASITSDITVQGMETIMFFWRLLSWIDCKEVPCFSAVPAYWFFTQDNDQ